MKNNKILEDLRYKPKTKEIPYTNLQIEGKCDLCSSRITLGYLTNIPMGRDWRCDCSMWWGPINVFSGDPSTDGKIHFGRRLIPESRRICEFCGDPSNLYCPPCKKYVCEGECERSHDSKYHHEG